MKKFLVGLIIAFGLAIYAPPVLSAPADAPAAVAPSDASADATKTDWPKTDAKKDAPKTDEKAKAEEEGGSSFMGLLSILLKVLGTAIAALVVGLVIKLLKKAGIDISASQATLLQSIAKEAVHYAESKAAKNAKDIKSDTKLGWAVNYINEHPKYVGMAKKVADDKLKDIIESALSSEKNLVAASVE